VEDRKELTMLVLSRRTNETLVIDNNIRFTVLSVHGNQVRIGIEAPDEVIVLREEIIHNGGRTHAPTAAQPAGLSATPQGSHQPRQPQPDAQTANAPYRRHDSGTDHNRGNEQGKRRGVLGLRRRRPS
jgi:carbon storage regulator